jgi:hypothetical protein
MIFQAKPPKPSKNGMAKNKQQFINLTTIFQINAKMIVSMSSCIRNVFSIERYSEFNI